MIVYNHLQQKMKVRIFRYKLKIVRKKSVLWDINSKLWGEKVRIVGYL